MTRTLRQALLVAALAGLTAACASTPPPRVSLPPSAGVYKVGNPYQIAGTWYYPHEQPDYDETGIASWYGPTFYGKRTANGEIFDANALTAAHRTLPMPVNVRVTNLENGKSLVVRVNDRGPFAKGRIIDLSERAAQLLGYYRQGTARVRVTYLGPRAARQWRAAGVADTPAGRLGAAGRAGGAGGGERVGGGPQAPPIAPPVTAVPLPSPVASAPTPAPAEAQPDGQVTRVPVPAVTHLYVQAGAFSSYDNARRAMARLVRRRWPEYFFNRQKRPASL